MYDDRSTKPTPCPKCGTAVETSFRFCGGCGHKISDLEPALSEVPAPSAVHDVTRRRSTVLTTRIDGPTGTPVPPKSRSTGVDPIAWQNDDGDEPGPARSTSAGGVPPIAVWLVALALAGLGVLIAYPFLHALPDLFGKNGLFSSSEFTRAFSALFLQVYVMILACSAVLIFLAIGLVRRSRVSQLLTCLLSAIVAVSEMIAAGQTDAAGADHTLLTWIIIVSIAIVALLVLPPDVRRFFRGDERPMGVVLAAVANVYLGSVAVVDSVLVMLAGAVGVKFVWYGLAFGVVGLALLLSNRPLRAGSRTARGLTAVGYAALIVVLFVLASVGDGAAASPATLIPVGLTVAAFVGLVFPASSQRHFAGPRKSLPRNAVASLGFAVAVVLVAGSAVAGFASSSQPSFDSAAGDPAPSFSEPDSFSEPAPVAEPSIVDTPTVPTTAAGDYVRSWTISETQTDGTQVTATLSVGDPQAYQAGLSNGTFEAGTGCSLTEGTDGVVPVELSIVNDGSTDADFGLNISGVGSQSIPGISGTELSFEASFSDQNDVCDDSDSFGLQTLNPVQPGGSISVAGFFDISNLYSTDISATPDEVVDDATLTIVADHSPSDNPDYTVTDVEGPGVVANGGSWSFNLGGV